MMFWCFPFSQAECLCSRYASRTSKTTAKKIAHGCHSTGLGSELSALSKQLGLSAAATLETLYAGTQLRPEQKTT